MAGVLRFGVLRVALRQQPKAFLPIVQQACNISGRALRGNQKLTKPKPYPYKEKPYSVIQAMMDKTTKRLDENSKIIVVEGPPAAGKSKFASELAQELDMLYMPEATMDMIYINEYGYDMRQLDAKLPELCRSFDVKNFLQNPNHKLAAQFQIRMYMLRYSQYIDALAHVLSTGEGVVLDRSPFSDFVFMETMFNNGFLSKGARSVYYQLRDHTLPEVFKPHLVIYLDVPVKKQLDNIKARNLAYEVKSKAASEKYLTDLQTLYKQQYLKDISNFSELLVYDWSAGGETEIVVEDIERIDFDRFDKHDPKLKEWRLPKEWDWCEARIKFAHEKADLMNYFNVPRYDVPELLRDPDDGKVWRDVWFDAPGMKYRLGYNEEMGDTGILTKTKLEVRDSK